MVLSQINAPALPQQQLLNFLFPPAPAALPDSRNVRISVSGRCREFAIPFSTARFTRVKSASDTAPRSSTHHCVVCPAISACSAGAYPTPQGHASPRPTGVRWARARSCDYVLHASRSLRRVHCGGWRGGWGGGLGRETRFTCGTSMLNDLDG